MGISLGEMSSVKRGESMTEPIYISVISIQGKRLKHTQKVVSRLHMYCTQHMEKEVLPKAGKKRIPPSKAIDVRVHTQLKTGPAAKKMEKIEV